MAEDCSGPYTGSDVSMSSTTDYNVSLVSKKVYGQTIKVCFECSNDYDIVVP